MHPFLSTDFHIRWSSLTPDTIEPSIKQALTEAKQAIEIIRSQPPAEATYESTFVALENATE